MWTRERPVREWSVKATSLYYNKENLYKEAFDLLRRIDQTIEAKGQGSEKASMHYLTTKERFQMYMKMHKTAIISVCSMVAVGCHHRGSSRTRLI